jgi:hypothetical protein
VSRAALVNKLSNEQFGQLQTKIDKKDRHFARFSIHIADPIHRDCSIYVFVAI